MLEYVAALLAGVDAALINSQSLDAVNDALPPISSALPVLGENEDFAQIAGIISGTDALLNAASPLAAAAGVWAKSNLKKAAATLGEAATEKTQDLQRQTDSQQERLTQLGGEIEQAQSALKTTSDERINELQGQLDAIKAAAEAQGKTVEENAANFQTQFASESEARAKEFEEAEQALKAEADKAIEEARAASAEAANNEKERADQAISNLETRSNEIIEFLEKKKEEAISLLDIVATSSTAGAFAKEAAEQKKQADRWRVGAVIFGLLAVAIATGSLVASFIVDTTTSETLREDCCRNPFLGYCWLRSRTVWAASASGAASQAP